MGVEKPLGHLVVPLELFVDLDNLSLRLYVDLIIQLCPEFAALGLDILTHHHQCGEHDGLKGYCHGEEIEGIRIEDVAGEYCTCVYQDIESEPSHMDVEESHVTDEIGDGISEPKMQRLDTLELAVEVLGDKVKNGPSRDPTMVHIAILTERELLTLHEHLDMIAMITAVLLSRRNLLLRSERIHPRRQYRESHEKWGRHSALLIVWMGDERKNIVKIGKSLIDLL